MKGLLTYLRIRGLNIFTGRRLLHFDWGFSFISQYAICALSFQCYFLSLCWKSKYVKTCQ